MEKCRFCLRRLSDAINWVSKMCVREAGSRQLRGHPHSLSSSPALRAPRSAGQDTSTLLDLLMTVNFNDFLYEFDAG